MALVELARLGPGCVGLLDPATWIIMGELVMGSDNKEDEGFVRVLEGVCLPS
jgi:hypothetical protein